MIYDISPVNNYDGNNTTTKFDFDFYIESPDELKVYLFRADGTKILLTNEIDYEINELRNTEGSYITYPIEGSSYSVLADNEKISLQMNLPLSQETQYNNSSLLNLSALEYSFDYLTRLIQIVSRKIDLCVKAEEGSGTVPGEIIDYVVSLSTSVIDRINQVDSTLDTLEDLSESATQMYNRIISSGQSIDTIQDEVTALSTSKANADGTNFASSIKAIDGQWVPMNLAILWLTVSDSSFQQYDLSSYFPADNYTYEVLMHCDLANAYRDDITLSFSVDAYGWNTLVPVATANVDSQRECCAVVIPIDTNRRIGFKLSDSLASSATVRFIAYRRIGTNA